MSVRTPSKGAEYGDGLAWLWISLALTGVPTLRRLFLPQDVGVAGALLDVFLTALLVAALIMVGASALLIFLSLQILWARPRRRGSGRAAYAAFAPTTGALVLAGHFVPTYAPTAIAAAFAVAAAAAVNVGYSALLPRPGAARASDLTGAARPGKRGGTLR